MRVRIQLNAGVLFTQRRTQQHGPRRSLARTHPPREQPIGHRAEARRAREAGPRRAGASAAANSTRRPLHYGNYDVLENI